jgi:hypothetical protein
MLHSQARRRVRRFQAMSHAFAGLTLVHLALTEEQGGGPLPWVAGVAAVLLLGLAGWERLQPTAQPPSAEIAGELLGMTLLVIGGLEKLHAGWGLLPSVYFLGAALLGAALVLHRRAHRAGHVAQKGAPG